MQNAARQDRKASSVQPSRRDGADCESGCTTDPMDIGLIGPYAVVQVADALAQLVENLE